MSPTRLPFPLRVALLAALLLSPALALAELTIEITQGRDDAVSIAVVPFALGDGTALGSEATLPVDIAGVVSFDLARSGQFVPLAPEDMLSYPSRAAQVFFRDWRIQGVQYLLIGRALPQPDAQVRIEWQLFDVLAERSIADGALLARPDRLRDAAHLVSDDVYEALTGLQGAYSSRIAYVLATGAGTPEARYILKVADSDGARARTLLDSDQPLLSPAWSPDGTKLAFVWFEDGLPGIWVLDVATGRRSRLTAFSGLNSAPAWSPDGRRLALVLSRDDNPELYVMDLAERRLQRLTTHYAIDTEPSWNADGTAVVFTSNRGGRPQIYQKEVASGFVERLTFEGTYNARARLLPDGRHLVFVHQRNNIFHIALMDLERGDIQVLTETDLDESPSVAPNGSMLIYATQDVGRGILAVVSVDGRVKYNLPSPDGDVREPAWSPLLVPEGVERLD